MCIPESWLQDTVSTQVKAYLYKAYTHMHILKNYMNTRSDDHTIDNKENTNRQHRPHYYCLINDF